MKVNTLGKTGLRVSALGLGGHEYRWGLHSGHLQDHRFVPVNPVRLEVVRAALEGGINYFDTTFAEEAQSLGDSLHRLGVRDQAIVSGMIVDLAKRAKELPPAEVEAYIRQEVETRLQLLQSDHFDVFLICSPGNDYPRDLLQDMLRVYDDLRQEGKFAFVGVSWHELGSLAEFLSWKPPVDVVMFRYNYAVHRNWDGNGAELDRVLGLAEEQGLGLVAIKALCWFHYGVPFTAYGERDWDAQADLASSVAWHVNNGATHSTVVGVETVPELQTLLSGVHGSTDEESLARYVPRCREIGGWLANACDYSGEIQWRMLTAAKSYTGQDLGEELEAYRQAWEAKLA